MSQRELYRQVAHQTGEEIKTIRRIGFSVEEPDMLVLDPEPNDQQPSIVDWDQLAAARYQ